MKRLILLIVLVLLGCASKRISVGIAGDEHNLSGVMRLIGRYSYGHACPCDGLILSAAHVVYPNHLAFILRPEPIYYAWSDIAGNSGYLRSAGAFRRDLGQLEFLEVLSGTPQFYRHALEEPQTGDPVHWQEYDFRTVEDAFGPRLKEVRIVRIISGHFVLKGPPVGGASGTCLFNERNEVIGIIAWFKPIGRGEAIGIAVSVAGPWWPQFSK